MKFYMLGNFRTRVHLEKCDIAFDSKMPYLVLKTLNGHETRRQATDLDDNFGTPLSVLAENPKIAIPAPTSAFPKSKI